MVTGIATDFPDKSVTEADGTEMAKSSSVKRIAAEGPPPGARLVTVTATPPAAPTAVEEIEAVSWVELTKLVGWGLATEIHGGGWEKAGAVDAEHKSCPDRSVCGRE